MTGSSEQSSNTINLVESYAALEPEYLLICTFTLSLGYIEQKFLNSYKEKHNTKTLIVSSATGVSQSFDDFYAVRGVGTQYIVAKVDDAPYAFHPKILLAIDRNLGPILYVTGCNFTYPGMAQNLDAVEFIELRNADGQTMANLNSFLDGLSYLVLSPEQEKILAEIKRRLPPGLDENSPFTFFHNMQTPIFDQIEAAIEGDVEEIKIISPYYDHEMKALKRFTELPGNPRCSILCNPSDEHVNLAALPTNVSVFTTSEEPSGRLLHAKVYLIITASKTYSVVGSANCTEPGMLKWPDANLPLNHKDRGNWEIMLFREISPDYVEELFQSYSPIVLAEEARWKYTPPPKPPKVKHRISFEAITHPGMLELQFDNRGAYGAIDGILHLKYVTGEQVSIPLEERLPNDQGFYLIPINSPAKNQGDRPFIVELSLTAPVDAGGATWAIQKGVLSRSKATNSLLRKLDELQADTPNGWTHFDALMDFISGNLEFLTASRRTASRGGRSKSESSSVQTIGGVYELDDFVPVAGEKELTLADMLHSGARFDSLFENGFNVAEGEDDESEEPDPANKSQGNRGRGNEDKPDRQSDPFVPEFELPDLRIPYQEQVIKKFNKRINTLTVEGSEEELGSILSSLVFSLKLARFIHIELSHKFPELNREPRDMFSVIAPLLKELPRWVEKSKEVLNLSDEQIVDQFETSGFFQELVLNVCEIWVEDRQDIIRFAKKVELVDLLQKYWTKQQISATLNSILLNSNRFGPGRRALMMDPSNVEEVIQSLWSHDENENKNAGIYRKAMRIAYFQQAADFHQLAYDIMTQDSKYTIKIQDESYIRILNKHRTRTEEAVKYIGQAKKALETIIDPWIISENLKRGNNFRLFPKWKAHSIVCAGCEAEISQTNWLMFRSGLHILCKNCDALMIPCEEQPEYNHQTVSDYTWAKMLR